MNSLLFILTSIAASSFAHVLLKKGMMVFEANRMQPDTFGNQIIGIIFQFWVPAGLFLHVAALGLWLLALRKADISFAYPFLSLGYVLVTVLAVVWLEETLNPWRLFGMLVIIIGILILSLGPK